MNEFEFIDYKQPVGLVNDMRTSTYRGHVYMSDVNLKKHSNVKICDKKLFTEDPEILRTRITDYQANYTIKPGKPGDVRNPSLSMKQQFIKPFDECKLRFLKRPMLPATSSSHEDFQWHLIVPEKRPQLKRMPEAVKTTPVIINRCAPSYVKYLDPSATTTRLDYCYRTPEEISRSVARKDNITFWNWKNIKQTLRPVVTIPDEHMCQQLPAQQCPKRRNEYPSLLKRVPHSGMNTEFRENYMEPRLRPLPDPEPQFIENALVHVDHVPISKTTESNVIGSGEKTQKYV